MAQHIFTGSGKPNSIPSKVGQHYVDTENNVHYISLGTSTTNDWKATAPRCVSIPVFNGQSNPFVQKTGLTYTRILDYVFNGSKSGLDISKVIIFAAEVGTGNGKFRIYDQTNARTIAEITSISGATGTKYSTTSIANIPEEEALFEIQIAHESETGNTYLSNVKLEF
jgi:hypothetical protein